jgi:hypothetical protein
MKKIYLLSGLTLIVISCAIFALAALTVPGKKTVAHLQGKKATVQEYRACGCGGCPTDSPPVERAFYSQQEFDQAVSQDKRTHASPDCDLMGCGVCQLYILKQ